MILLLSAAALLAGSFKWSLPVEDAPSHLLAADLDHGGRPDLITTGQRLTVLRNAGRERFTVTAALPEAAGASELAAGDFNGDGHLDIATADHDTFAVTIWAGDGRGGLRKLSIVRAKATGQPHVHGLLADGRHLLFVSSGEGEVIPLRNDGHGRFTPGVPVRTRSPFNPALGDVNGDGHADLVAGSFEGREIAVWLGDGQGRFQPAAGSPYPVFPRVFATRLADLDGDGDLDIYACHDDHGRLTVLLGDGRGGFREMPGSPFDLGREAYGVQAVDLDRDGRLDLAAVSLKGDLLVLLQTKPGVFAGPPAVRANVGAGYRLAAADFDGDRRPELASADPDGKAIRFFIPGLTAP